MNAGNSTPRDTTQPADMAGYDIAGAERWEPHLEHIRIDPHTRQVHLPAAIEADIAASLDGDPDVRRRRAALSH